MPWANTNHNLMPHMVIHIIPIGGITPISNLNKKLDGLKNDFKKKWDNLQDSIENLINQQQYPLEEECQSDTMVEEQCQQQPHQGLIEDFIEMSEGLSESLDTCVVVFPREKKEEILLFITEESSEQETVERIQEPIIQPIPINLYPGAFAQPQNSPLPVYILPTPAAKSKPAAPAPKAHASPSLPVQSFKRSVATV